LEIMASGFGVQVTGFGFHVQGNVKTFKAAYHPSPFTLNPKP
jgi:hypothetical protein